MEARTSISPDGTVYPLPTRGRRCGVRSHRGLVAEASDKGQEIVVVMGVGFVGAVMAAIVADTVDESGTPSKFVIGVQRPSTRSYWKIPVLNRASRRSRPRTPRSIR